MTFKGRLEKYILETWEDYQYYDLLNMYDWEWKELQMWLDRWLEFDK